MTPSAAQSHNTATQANGLLNIPIPALDRGSLNLGDGFTWYLQDRLAKDEALLERWKKARLAVEMELEAKYRGLPPEERDVYEKMVVMPPGWA
jgi:hypothetical protein